MFNVDLKRQIIVNAFLTEVDGLNSSEGILIIGATHRFDNIDPAATRSGRLSEVVNLSQPTHKSRCEIWTAHLKNKLVKDLNIDALSHASSGFSGADIAQAISTASILAAQEEAHYINMRHFLKACDNIFWGNPDGSMVINDNEKNMIAHHEAGHALLAWKNNLIVNRITITPRKSALGAVHWTQDEGSHSMNLEALKGRVEMILGGICSEKVIFGAYSNGGTSDLINAQKLINHTLIDAGLGKQFYFGKIDNWSNEQRLNMEQEMNEFMKECFDNSISWLEQHKQLITELANTLLDKKEISGQELDLWKEKVNFYQPQIKHSHQQQLVLHLQSDTQ